MIELRDLVHIYPNGVRAVNNLNLQINDSEICVLIGPSGCGKSTTLNMLNKLIPVTSGEIMIDGHNIEEMVTTELRRNIGYAIQDVALFPHRTVAENIATVPALKRWSRQKINARVEELLDLMGLEPAQYRDKYPIQLSGGEQQRVGVARALGANPPILLMDEPFGAIDPITRARLQDEFLLIQEKIHKTIVFVTHDIHEAIKMGDKIAIINEGQLVQSGTPKDILQNPANRFVEEFMGEDRHMKWLQLILAEEILEQQNMYCLQTDNYQAVLEKFKQSRLNSLPVVNADQQLIGYVRANVLKNSKQPWDEKIKKYDEWIDKKTTIYDALFALMLDVNNYLPIVDKRGKYLGVITQDKVNAILADIKNEVKEVEHVS
ncbi:MAG TPA: ABC transporter ATP-binding protein [Oscillospiraceae bacterium]|nr:ABC transporter ATP-binding protein [Oscillospiraceae bacterium]